MILYSHFEFLLDLDDKKITLRSKIKLFLGLIRINIQLYPPKKKKNKKKKGNLKLLKLLKDEIVNIIKLIRKIKVVKLYSNLYFANTNYYLNVYITAFINALYGSIANIIDCEKLYLNIIPNFTENKIKGSVRVHIKFRIIMIFKLMPILIRILLRKLFR